MWMASTRCSPRRTPRPARWSSGLRGTARIPWSFRPGCGWTRRTRWVITGTAASCNEFCGTFVDGPVADPCLCTCKLVTFSIDFACRNASECRVTDESGTLTEQAVLLELVPGQSRLRGRSRRHPSLATDAQAWARAVWTPCLPQPRPAMFRAPGCIWRRLLATLWRYAPQTRQRGGVLRGVVRARRGACAR